MIIYYKKIKSIFLTEIFLKANERNFGKVSLKAFSPKLHKMSDRHQLLYLNWSQMKVNYFNLA